MDKGKQSVTVYNALVSARKSKPDLLQQPYMKKLYQSDEKQIIELPHQLENYNNAAIVPQSDHTQVITIHHKITDVFTGEFLGVISDRKSTRLNSSHVAISYAVFCLKK